MSSKVPLPTSSPSSDPALLKVTEAITGTPDAKAASGIADMLLIFLSAAGTILGALLVAMVYVTATGSRVHDGSWIFQLLVCVGAGGVLGCLAVMGVLHARTSLNGRTDRVSGLLRRGLLQPSLEVRISDRLWLRPVGLEKRTSAAKAIS